MMVNASARNSCVYMYSNLKGCDGTRLFFDGASLITMNGKVYSQAEQMSIGDVDVDVAIVDLDEVRSQRIANVSRGLQAAQQSQDFYPKVFADIEICKPMSDFSLIAKHKEAVILDPM